MHRHLPRTFKLLPLAAALLLAAGGVLASTPDDSLARGHCVADGKIEKTLPSVIITHGWRYRNTEFNKPPEPLLGLGRDIRQRLDEEQPPAAIRGRRVNVIYFVWPEASYPLRDGAWRLYTLARDWCQAGDTAKMEGAVLAVELRRLLGNDYRQPVQFIGHSFGALVNAFAVRQLAAAPGWNCDAQFTILDAGIGWTLLSGDGFRRLLPDTGPLRVQWVDNYVGLPGVAVGTMLPGAGPGLPVIGGKIVARSHCGVIAYYRETVRDIGSHAGFYFSRLLGNCGGWNSRQPSFWKP